VDTLSYKTKSANSQTVKKEWFIVDAQDMILGRLSSEVAKILRGKHKPSFTPHVDCGDYVIVTNAAKVKLSGKKWTDRLHFSYSGFPGGQKQRTPREILDKYPNRLIEHSVRGMLPKNRLGRQLFRNLFVYDGAEHPHAEKQPKELKI